MQILRRVNKWREIISPSSGLLIKMGLLTTLPGSLIKIQTAGSFKANHSPEPRYLKEAGIVDCQRCRHPRDYRLVLSGK